MPYLKAPSGVIWNFDCEGEGEDLLFLHGWGVDSRIWRQQSKFFSLSYRVILADLPGHGKSSWLKISLEKMANDLDAILRILAVDRLTVIGSSLGGMLGLKYVELFPEKLKRIVFVGSMPRFAASADYPYGLDVERIRKLSSQLHSDYPSIVDIFFRSLFTQQERKSRRFRWLNKFRQEDKNISPLKPALVQYLDILEEEDLREVLRGLKIPLQFINGSDDTICNQETLSYLRQLKPHARFDIFQECGHFPFLSKPHEFNKVLGDFLKN